MRGEPGGSSTPPPLEGLLVGPGRVCVRPPEHRAMQGPCGCEGRRGAALAPAPQRRVPNKAQPSRDGEMTP